MRFGVECSYNDLGEKGDKNIVLDRENSTVTVNTGVTEDELDKFLSSHGYMLKTVTAGGFFSIGGISVVDVHGASMKESIFSSNIIAYTVVGPSGYKNKYDKSLKYKGYSALQFHRTSLGTLGVVTSVTIKVKKLNNEKLVPSFEDYSITSRDDFIVKYKKILYDGGYNSIESFYDPYAPRNNILALKWRIEKGKEKAKYVTNTRMSTHLTEACIDATHKKWGAPILPKPLEILAESTGMLIQNHSHNKNRGSEAIKAAMFAIKGKMRKAIRENNALWLTGPAERAVFMSYFIPLGSIKDPENSLSTAWDALQVVRNRLLSNDKFVAVIPTEFRFVRGSDALLSGTYSDANPNGQLFVSIEVLALVPKGNSESYPQSVKNYFASIEKEWVQMGGFPHNGKIFGFYAPTFNSRQSNNNELRGESPFNEDYIRQWQERKNKSNALTVFSEYQKMLDPNGLFCNNYTYYLGICQK